MKLDDLWQAPHWQHHVQRLLNSYRYWTGAELISRDGSPEIQAHRLFHAPLVVVSHGTEADPILNYGNGQALALWEMGIETFLQTPSRQTAEPVHRAERAALLERTTRNGFVDDYRGVRISSTGRRFRIERATVWNVRDDSGQIVGQGATFDEWTPLGPE